METCIECASFAKCYPSINAFFALPINALSKYVFIDRKCTPKIGIKAHFRLDMQGTQQNSKQFLSGHSFVFGVLPSKLSLTYEPKNKR